MSKPENCTPSAGDRLAVGSTLRALAANGTPNAETAEVLERVGVWLVECALTEIAERKGGQAA